MKTKRKHESEQSAKVSLAEKYKILLRSRNSTRRFSFLSKGSPVPSYQVKSFQVEVTSLSYLSKLFFRFFKIQMFQKSFKLILYTFYTFSVFGDLFSYKLNLKKLKTLVMT